MDQSKNLIALDILNYLSNGLVVTPRQIARSIDGNPAYVRSALVHLKALKLVQSPHYGEYQITEFGQLHLQQVKS